MILKYKKSHLKFSPLSSWLEFYHMPLVRAIVLFCTYWAHPPMLKNICKGNYVAEGKKCSYLE